MKCLLLIINESSTIVNDIIVSCKYFMVSLLFSFDKLYRICFFQILSVFIFSVIQSVICLSVLNGYLKFSFPAVSTDNLRNRFIVADSARKLSAFS